MIMAFRAVVVAGIILALAGIARAQGGGPLPNEVHLSAEIWLAILGGAVTLGINFEQLRRSRRDIFELKREGIERADDLKKELERSNKSQDRWKLNVSLRLQSIEESLGAIKGYKRKGDIPIPNGTEDL